MTRRTLHWMNGLTVSFLLILVPFSTHHAVSDDGLQSFEALLSHGTDDCPAHHQGGFVQSPFSPAPSGGSSIIGMAHSTSYVPGTYVLEQNYPNPFNPTTTIPFTLAEAGSVDLRVYNMWGQRVATLVLGHLPAGKHRVDWEVYNLPSGTYQYVLRAGAFQESRRMALVK